LPEPTAAELAKEAEQEAAVFAQAVNIDKVLTMLCGLDPAKDNLADNEEIQVRTQYYRYRIFAKSSLHLQELYRSSMALRPRSLHPIHLRIASCGAQCYYRLMQRRCYHVLLFLTILGPEAW